MNSLVLQLGLYQVLAPLVLIAANTFVASASRSGLILRSAGLFVLLIYAAQAGLWLFPPWWTPYALMVLLVLGAAYRFRRTKPPHSAWIRYFEGVTAGALLIGAALVLGPVFQARTTPDGAIDLAMPLGPGRYLVTSGGTNETINAHLFTLTAERARAFRGQSYAVDIIGVDGLGLRANGISPVDPSAYRIYGTAVLAPCAGTVVLAIDGLADMPVPQMDRANMTGNSVMLDCGGYVVLLAHLAPNSIRVTQDQMIETGTQIGAVGNSGNTGEPHLHIHVQESFSMDDPVSANPMWFTLEGRFLVRNDPFAVVD